VSGACRDREVLGLQMKKKPIDPGQSKTTEQTFWQLGAKIGNLVDKKNAAYGDSFAKSGAFLRLLYPDGIRPDQYDDALCLIRIFDKQMRIATAKNAFGESPYGDIGGYALLGLKMCDKAAIQTSSCPEKIDPDASGKANACKKKKVC
jgi:hypothetical protein